MIAGASGFIGRELIHKFCKSESMAVAGLTRSDRLDHLENIEVRKCNLFSLKETEQALEGMDIGIYLVHSMLPSSSLTQGDFEDFDFILADNFARAAQTCGLKKIIFVSGIIPDKQKMSHHLASRFEVEKVFKAYPTPYTIFRAGLIVGHGSSSFNIVSRLVDNLPAMICPSWTNSLSQPLHVSDLVDAIEYSLVRSDTDHQTYDLGCEKPISYINIMKSVAKSKNLKRVFLQTPFFSPALSCLWVRIFARAPKQLVYPLIYSLKHSMLVSDDRKFCLPPKLKDFSSILDAVKEKKPIKNKNIRAFTKIKASAQENDVCSVQRLQIPGYQPASWITKSYRDFLQKTFKFMITVSSEKGVMTFKFFNLVSLLELELAESRSDDYRQLFYIIGGALCRYNKKGRFEFRKSRTGSFAVVAIYDFTPRLPWFIYKYTQAIIHLMTMGLFQRYLKNKVS